MPQPNVHTDGSLGNPDLWIGTVRLDPTGPVVAGSLGMWTLAYTVGRYGIDTGGRIKVAWRVASDWGTPQTTNPRADNYVTATTTGQAKLAVRYDRLGCDTRPFLQGLTLSVIDGTLKEGDVVHIVLGDQSAGSRGAVAQCFADETFEFRVLVECFQTGVFERLPTSPTVRIMHGLPARLVLTAPSQVTAGVPVAVAVRVEDIWGNLCRDVDEEVIFEPDQRWQGAPQSCRVGASGSGVAEAEGFVASAPGILTVAASIPRLELHAVSNPVDVQSRAPDFLILWGDIHGQTGETVGTGTPEAYFGYARDVARLDFCAHQANDFQFAGMHWEHLKRVVRSFHDPGRFVTFLGYEWSGNTPAGGDRNVYYLGDDGPLHRSSHWQVADRSDAHFDRYPVSELFASLKDRSDVLMIPHVGGRPCDLAYHAPDLEPVIEICSVWGEFEWLAEEALARGYRIGFVANSDDHTCRPGACRALNHHFSHRGGLTAVYATDRTREAIWEAYFARRCYATSGERILLEVIADGHPMGSAYATDRPPTLVVRAAGVGPLDRVEVRRGLASVYRHLIRHGGWAPGRVRITWEGARSTGRGRTTTWDGFLHLSAGHIQDARDIHRHNPTLGIIEHGDRRVAWRSSTSGDLAGVVVDLEAPADATISVTTDPCDFAFTLRELESAGEIVVEAGGVGQRVTVERVPLEVPPKQVAFQFIDAAVPPGRHAYWVRVQQIDGERAWSSPIYVDVRSDVRATD